MYVSFIITNRLRYVPVLSILHGLFYGLLQSLQAGAVLLPAFYRGGRTPRVNLPKVTYRKGQNLNLNPNHLTLEMRCLAIG